MRQNAINAGSTGVALTATAAAAGAGPLHNPYAGVYHPSWYTQEQWDQLGKMASYYSGTPGQAFEFGRRAAAAAIAGTSTPTAQRPSLVLPPPQHTSAAATIGAPVPLFRPRDSAASRGRTTPDATAAATSTATVDRPPPSGPRGASSAGWGLTSGFTASPLTT